ncbi:PAS domain-containing protein [Paracoccus sp. S-4012]|uniref:PAS domain-containing protein n=1 Tax=Paracoccus sp. S-4012 TaxID=2665648 RepID=UPI0012B1104C|nr:PAS domain-containing protein [Paracoccus sp. S-4012]MRX51282.1 PAS domain-containing protein [Paracoccus sp. S-4012]
MQDDDGMNCPPRPAGAAPPRGAELVRLSEAGPLHAGRTLGELRAYWDGLRRGRAVPERGDIEPRGLRGAIAHAFILERIAPGAARFRLAGRHLIDLMGMEVRGMPFCALFNPASRGHLSDVLETVFAAPQIAELTMLSPLAYGRPALPARMLVLPLSSDLGDVTRALGAIVAEGGIGRPPRRFDLVSEALTPVIEGARTLLPTPSRPGFAEPPEVWRPPAVPFPSPRRGAAKPDPPEPAPTGSSGAAARRAGFRVIPGGR